ncbi:MAG: GDSL-type esterase/lipase family protein, partial [Armatimonadota bacterium]
MPRKSARRERKNKVLFDKLTKALILGVLACTLPYAAKAHAAPRIAASPDAQVHSTTKPGLRDGDVVMCFGDSITENGDLAWGYVEQMRNLVKTWKPQWNVKFTACGFAGAGASFSSYLLDQYVARKSPAEEQNDRIRNLFATIDAKPTIVVFLFGVNDVCGNEIAKSRPADMTRIMDEYFRGIDKIRAIINPREIWLSPPLCAGERKTTPKNSVILEYGPLLAKLAPKHGARVLSTQTDFWNTVQTTRKLWPDTRLTLDGIHPNVEGHRLIARAVLKGLGLNGPEKAMPAPVSYLPEAERERIANDAVALSYDITAVDNRATDDTTTDWRLYLTNLGTTPVKLSLKTTLPSGFRITNGSVPAELSLRPGRSREIGLTVLGPLRDEKTELVATANWLHNGKH